MTDIPEDIQRTVAEVLGTPHAWDSYDTLSLRAARAILAERERCANVAKEMLKFADTTSGADEAIPAAILDPNHWLARNPALLAPA